MLKSKTTRTIYFVETAKEKHVKVSQVQIGTQMHKFL
jgi:hypothetical protein